MQQRNLCIDTKMHSEQKFEKSEIEMRPRLDISSHAIRCELFSQFNLFARLEYYSLKMVSMVEVYLCVSFLCDRRKSSSIHQ